MELRHLRYFTAVVQWKGYREASRHLYIAQPSISQAVSDLESELGIKLFSREGRVARLTPEGQVFYEEAIKTLAQAETIHCNGPARGQGRNRKARHRFHRIRHLLHFSPTCCANTRLVIPGSLSVSKKMCRADRTWHSTAARSTSALRVRLPRIVSSSYDSRLIFREPLVVALPKTRKVKAKRIRIADLAGERFVIFQRASSPEVFDTIIRVCNDRASRPRLHNELNNMQSVLVYSRSG